MSTPVRITMLYLVSYFEVSTICINYCQGIPKLWCTSAEISSTKNIVGLSWAMSLHLILRISSLQQGTEPCWRLQSSENLSSEKHIKKINLLLSWYVTLSLLLVDYMAQNVIDVVQRCIQPTMYIVFSRQFIMRNVLRVFVAGIYSKKAIII